VFGDNGVLVVQGKGSHALLLFTHDGSSRVAHVRKQAETGAHRPLVTLGKDYVSKHNKFELKRST